MNKREYWIDALKAFACILVLIDHFVLAFGNKGYILGTLLKCKYAGILLNGNWAVCLFLILSSYIISNQIIRMKALDGKKIMSTMVKRYFRLFLPVFTISVGILIMYKLNLFSSSIVGELTNNEWLSRYFVTPLNIKNLLSYSLVEVWWSGSKLYNGPFWMLGIMLKGTFLAIIVMLMARRNKYGWTVILCLLGLFFLKQSYYFAILLGVLWSYLKFHTKWMDPSDKKWVQIVWLFVLIVVIGSSGYRAYILNFVKTYIPVETYLNDNAFWNTVGAFMMIIAVSKSSVMIRILEKSKTLTFIGKYNFGIYLVHWPLMCSFSTRLYIHLMGKIANERLMITIIGIMSMIVITIGAVIYTKIFENNLHTKAINCIMNKYMSGYSEE